MTLHVPASRYRRMLAEECARLGVSLDGALSRSRGRAAYLPRYRVWRRLREAGHSLIAIGRVAGVDHTSVLHGLDRLSTIEIRVDMSCPRCLCRHPRRWTCTARLAEARGG